MKNICVLHVMLLLSAAILSNDSRVPGSGLIPEPLMPIRHTYLPTPICYVTFQGLSSVLGSAQALCCSHFSQGLPFSRQESY